MADLLEKYLKPKEFEVVTTIDTEGQLRFEVDISLASPTRTIDFVSLSGAGQVKCLLKITANDASSATDQAEIFTQFIAELLTYAFKVRTTSVLVQRCSLITESGSQSTVNLSVSADAVLQRVVTAESSQEFVKLLHRKCSPRAEQLLAMYRQARNEHSVGARYLLMYRLIESCKGNQKAIDDWIRSKRSSVKESNERGGKRITIYTDLRNRIHARHKEPLYPYKEITSRVNEIEELAKLAVTEECESA